MIKIIIGGGDPCVIELVNILDAHKIDFKRCQFGVLPLGVENDLAVALRWRSNNIINFHKKIYKIIINRPL
jgi:diacylglycerol kinase family enzyme